MGVYWNLETIPTKIGLLLRITDTPHLSPSQLIIRTALRQKNYCIECADTQSARKLVSKLAGAERTLRQKGLDRNLIRTVQSYLDGTRVYINYVAYENKQGLHELTNEEVAVLLSETYGDDFLLDPDDADDEDDDLL